MKISIYFLLILFPVISFCQEKTEYYNNGNIESIENVQNGIRTGEWKYFYSNGQLESIQYFEMIVLLEYGKVILRIDNC